MTTPPKRSVAGEIVHHANIHRRLTLISGYTVSLALIGLGFLLTQAAFGTASTGPQQAQNEISAKGAGLELIAKNTAPGITFILCGTAVFIVTINRKFYAKTQWEDSNHPGYTEVNG